MRKILLTGGAGFIGSNLTRQLLGRGQYQVTCLDNFDCNYSRRQKLSNIEPFIRHANYRLIEGDIRRMEDLRRAGEVDAIVHLAAKVGVRSSIEEPLLYQDVNIGGTQNLLEFAKANGVGQFVFASSSSVYGVNKNVPWKEDEYMSPISPYAVSKLSNEMSGHVYSHLYGMRFLALRFFTVYGPAQRPDLAIYKFFESILKGRTIPVYGDGSTSRDYTFVDDICSGIMKAIDYEASDFEVINLGNGHSIELIALIREIELICGRKAVIGQFPSQPGDVPMTYSDISKAKYLLGYYPSTNLRSGLYSFYNWYMNSGNIPNLNWPAEKAEEFS